jgi:hypothetical protein
VEQQQQQAEELGVKEGSWELDRKKQRGDMRKGRRREWSLYYRADSESKSEMYIYCYSQASGRLWKRFGSPLSLSLSDRPCLRGNGYWCFSFVQLCPGALWSLFMWVLKCLLAFCSLDRVLPAR